MFCSRCITNQRPLLESGTMGAKGHVQVIVPYMTESYSSQVSWDIFYCLVYYYIYGVRLNSLSICLSILCHSDIFQRDPIDEDVPYCTLKSFPATIDHCIEWAREKASIFFLDFLHIHFHFINLLKFLFLLLFLSCTNFQFETLFNQKPSTFNKFWSVHGSKDEAVQVNKTYNFLVSKLIFFSNAHFVQMRHSKDKSKH